jgi:hypothetical protein
MSIRKCIKDEALLFIVLDQDGFIVAAFRHREDALNFVGR